MKFVKTQFYEMFKIFVLKSVLSSIPGTFTKLKKKKCFVKSFQDRIKT